MKYKNTDINEGVVTGITTPTLRGCSHIPWIEELRAILAGIGISHIITGRQRVQALANINWSSGTKKQ